MSQLKQKIPIALTTYIVYEIAFHKNNVTKYLPKFPILKSFLPKIPFHNGKETSKLIAFSCETNTYTSLYTLGVNDFSTSLTINVIYLSDSYSTQAHTFLSNLRGFLFTLPLN